MSKESDIYYFVRSMSLSAKDSRAVCLYIDKYIYYLMFVNLCASKVSNLQPSYVYKYCSLKIEVKLKGKKNETGLFPTPTPFMYNVCKLM